MSWSARERRTAELLRSCWETLPGASGTKARQLVGLIRLCWITVTSGYGFDAEHSPLATTWRGLDEIFGTEIEAAAPSWGDRRALIEAGLPGPIATLATRPTGMINYRRALRNRADKWVCSKRVAISRLFERAAALPDDDDGARVDLARRIVKLGRIPLKRGTSDPANILTPVLACLDPASRFPIIGGGNADARNRLGLGRSDLPDAWIAHDVVQCGWCQPGQCMAAAALISEVPNPDDKAIDGAMAGNLCRCGTYPRIREAIQTAAKNAAAKGK